MENEEKATGSHKKAKIERINNLKFTHKKMGFKELCLLIKKFFLLEFIVSMSPIITFRVQYTIRITWAKGECWVDVLYRRVYF